ncbi:DDB1- and CUL4-associated factor 4, partial [Stegodyphus mimosarum]
MLALDDELSQDFMLMQSRQWSSGYTTAVTGYSSELHCPTKTKRDEIMRSNQKTLQFNIHSGVYNKLVDFKLPHCLQYRENGMTSKCNLSSQVVSLKLRQLKLVNSSRVDLSDYVSCYYVKGFKRDLVGVWTYHEYSAALLKSVSFQYSKLTSKSDDLLPSISEAFCSDIVNLPSYKVFDLCGLSTGDQDYILYVANSYSRHKNIAHLAPIDVNEWADQPDDVVRRFEHQEILWSCAWNSFKRRFAIGADRCFYLHDYVSFSDKIELPKGQPHSLDFNSNGNLLYCGLHMGELTCFDLRSDDRVPALTVSLCKNISYIKLLSDEQTIIASGFNNVLLNIDLRTKKIVFQYPNHHSLYKKLAFSLDESLNILCAPGEDNITRLWTLNDGKLLHS